MLKVLFAVVDREGEFKRKRDGYHVYARRSTADGHASADGDSVVELVWDTDREPLLIRRKRVSTE